MKLTNGAYKAIPTAHQMIGDEGKERYAITFRLLEGPESGKTITFYGGFAGKGSDFTLKVIETCGWDPKTTDDFTSAKLEKEVIIVLEDDTFVDSKGQTRTETKVKFVNSTSGGPDFTKSAVPAAKAKDLAKSLAERYKANSSAGKEDEYTTATRKGKPVVDDSDIPF